MKRLSQRLPITHTISPCEHKSHCCSLSKREYFSSLKTDNNIFEILKKEAKLSLDKKNILEKSNKENYEEYIKKYFI